MFAKNMLVSIILFFSISTSSFSSPTFKNGIVKLLEFDGEIRRDVTFINEIRVKDKVILFSTGGASDGFEIWSHETGESEIKKIFDNGMAVTNSSDILLLDDDRILFFLKDLDKWYVTDGTASGTREFTEINEIVKDAPFTGYASSRLTFVGTNTNSSLSVIYDRIGYNVNPADGAYEQIRTEVEFSVSDIKAVIGGTIFHTRFDHLYAVDQQTFEETLVLEDTSNRRDISFHDPRFSDPATSQDSGKRRFNDLKKISDLPIIKEGFINVRGEDNFSLTWIKNDGEIFPIPITSEVPFVQRNIIHDGKTMYAQVFQSEQTIIVKIDLTTFEFEVVEIDLLPGSLCSFYTGFEPIYMTDEGLVLSTTSECSNQRIKQLVYLQNDGVVRYIDDGDGALEGRFELISVSEEALIFSAVYQDEDQFWSLNLAEFSLSRITKENTIAPSMKYTLNGIYHQSVSRKLEQENYIKLLSQIDFSAGVPSSIHVFDQAITSKNVPAEMVETASGTVFRAKPSGTKFDLFWTLKLSDSEQLETISRLEGERRNTLFFSHLNMLEILLMDLGQSGERDFSLFDPIAGTEGEKFTLPELEDGSFFKNVTDYQNGEVLVTYTSTPNRGEKFNFGKLDLDDLNIDFFHHELDSDFLDAQFCGDSTVYIGDNNIYVESNTQETTIHNLPEIFRTSFSDNQYLGLVTYDSSSEMESIYSYNCMTEELTLHTSYSHPSSNYFAATIQPGIQGRFLVTGLYRDNIRVNASNGETNTFPSTEEKIDEQRFAQFVDTNYGLYAFVLGSGKIENDERIYKTFVFKEAGNEFVHVNQFPGKFLYFESSEHDPLNRLFNIENVTGGTSVIEDNQISGGDLAYYSPQDNSFGFIDVIPGQKFASFMRPHFSEDGSLFISTSGHLGADIYRINLLCDDLTIKDSCSQTYENSAPQLLGPSEYEIIPGQQVHLPIRVIDEDRDIMSISASDLPDWLNIKQSILTGTVPEQLAASSINVTILAEDSESATDTLILTLLKKQSSMVENLSKQVETSQLEPDEPSTPPAEPTSTPPPTQQSGGGAINQFWLLVLIFWIWQRAALESN
jgi:hypothetical protein